MRSEFRSLERQFIEIKEILGEVHTAIVGNPLTHDGGLVARITAAENQLDSLQANFIKAEKKFEERMVSTEKKQIKYNVYTVIMWASLGGVAMAVFLYVLDIVLRNVKQ